MRDPLRLRQTTARTKGKLRIIHGDGTETSLSNTAATRQARAALRIVNNTGWTKPP